MSAMASLTSFTAAPSSTRQHSLQRPTPLSLARSPAAAVSCRRAPRSVERRQAVQTRAVAEVMQLAGEGGEIWGTAAVMFAITLVGLSIGFVLLRVESLVEEGKI